MDEITTIWVNLERCMECKVPMSLKYILWKSGYDTIISVKQMNEKRIEELESFIQKKRSEILLDTTLNENYDMSGDMCVYQKQTTFQFLPGHKKILFDLPEQIQKMQSELALQSTSNHDYALNNANEYSIILSELINSAKRNKNKSKHAFHYDDTIKFFSTYIFLLCGRTCYETLTKNLPIPSTKTVCKYICSLPTFKSVFYWFAF